MNDDKTKSQTIKPIAGNAIPTSEDHPLHILDNQTDPSKKPRKFDVPQKPIRTFEKDIEEEMARLKAAGTPVKESGGAFSLFKRKKPSFVTPITPKKEVAVEAPIPRPVEKVKVEYKKTEEVKPEEIRPVSIKSFEQAVEEASERKNSFKAKMDERSIDEIESKSIPNTKPPVSTVDSYIPIKQSSENLRTYEGDVAEALSQKKSSVLSMAIAESKKRDNVEVISNKPSSHTGRNIFLTFASIIFIVGGSIGGYYLYLKSPLAKVIVKPIDIKIAGIINSDIQKVVLAPSIQKTELIAFITEQFNDQNISPDKITEFITTYKKSPSSKDPEGVEPTTERVTSSQFINAAGFSMTDTLKRALVDSWMTGIYSSEEQNFPFIILKTDFFQNSFAGMLKWEADMPEELSDILHYTVTGKGSFRDKIIMNRDIREYTNELGEVVVLYTFIDKDTLLITTSEAVVLKILERIEKQSYIR